MTLFSWFSSSFLVKYTDMHRTATNPTQRKRNPGLGKVIHLIVFGKKQRYEFTMLATISLNIHVFAFTYSE